VERGLGSDYRASWDRPSSVRHECCQWPPNSGAPNINKILTCAFLPKLPRFAHGKEGRQKIREKDIGGLKYCEQLGELLQQASELQKVQKKPGCPRTSLGSLSESVAVFDPERLKPIIESLGERHECIAADGRLSHLQHTPTTAMAPQVRTAMASFAS
jgi:hypothetical protein